jgi:hypothetical protein
MHPMMVASKLKLVFIFLVHHQCAANHNVLLDVNQIPSKPDSFDGMAVTSFDMQLVECTRRVCTLMNTTTYMVMYGGLKMESVQSEFFNEVLLADSRITV